MGGTAMEHNETTLGYEPPQLVVMGSVADLTRVTVEVFEGSICANFPDHDSCVN